MLAYLAKKLMSLPLSVHAALTTAAFVGFQLAKTWLDTSYAASGHPVDYATGQLTFNAAKIMGFYQTMSAKGTLGIYWRTQIIDFSFILGVAALGFTLGTLIARAGNPGSWTYRLGKYAAGAAIAGATFDAIENLLSFAMLWNPASIPQPLAVVYSTAAAIKFALITLAMALMLAAAISAMASLLQKLRSQQIQ